MLGCLETLYLVIWHAFIWSFKLQSPPCPSTRSIFRIHSTTRLYFPLCHIYYFTVEYFLNHSQYLITVYSSTFYGEGFWDAPFHPPERGSGF